MGDYVDPYDPEDDGEGDFQEVFQDYNQDDDTTISSYKKKQRKLWNSLNSVDKDYRKAFRTIKGKKTEIGMYSTSSTPGTMIRDAIHGKKCAPFRVGSRDEDLFFKVKLSTGDISRNSDTFYFDSPEQYERHLMDTISQPIKEAWTNKFILAQKVSGH